MQQKQISAKLAQNISHSFANPTYRAQRQCDRLLQRLIANTETIELIPDGNLKLNGVKLQHTSHIKYVGITFDEHLTFKRHITLLNSKLKRANK